MYIRNNLDALIKKSGVQKPLIPRSKKDAQYILIFVAKCRRYLRFKASNDMVAEMKGKRVIRLEPYILFKDFSGRSSNEKRWDMI